MAFCFANPEPHTMVEGGVSFWSNHSTMPIETGYSPSFTVRLDLANQSVILEGLSVEEHKSLSALSMVPESPLITIPLKQLGELPHELIRSYMLGSESQCNLKFEDIWLPGRTPGFNVFPDGCQISATHISVLEIKTCVAGTRSQSSKVWKQYNRHSLQTRIPMVVVFFGVSPCEVTYPLGYPLSQLDLRVLCRLVALGKHVITECALQGYSETLWARDAIDQIQMPKLDLPTESEDKLLITDEMINTWDKLPVLRNLGESLSAQVSQRLANPTQQPSELIVEGEDQNLGLLPFGLVVADLSYGQETSPPSELISAVTNPLLKELLIKHIGSGRKKVRLSDKQGVCIMKSPQDYYRGLWGDSLNEGFNPFRVHRRSKKGPARPEKDPRMKLLSQRTLENMGLCISAAQVLRSEKLEREQAKTRRSLPIVDVDIAPFARTLFAEVGEGMEERYPTVDGSPDLEMPYTKEAWYWHCRFWQRMTEEICVGRYSAQGDWNLFHIQKIEPFNAWIYVHGTGPDSHQFYYCVVKLRSTPRYVRRWEDLGGGWWATTHIQSMRTDKITQHLNLLEKLVMLRSFWAGIFPRDRMETHFCISFLIALDAKQATIDTLSLFRYVYMELCKETSNRCPSKISTKLPNFVRTPVQQLIISRLYKLCNGDWGDLSMNEESELSFSNLPSWVDWQPVPSFKVILSLSYMHYATSHPISSGLSGRIQIMGKVLQEELKLPKTDYSRIGWSSPSFKDIGEHEFSVGAVKLMAQLTSRRLQQNYPVFESLMREFSCRMRELNFSDFATFKKSTRIDSEDPAARAYCFEEVTRLMDRLQISKEGVNCSPYQYLGKLVAFQESEPRCRNVSLFVKDQQTGLREIFVLTMNLRILIKFMEILSRIINECLPNETLCFPSRKRELVHTHQSQYSRHRSALIAASSTSDCPPPDPGFYWTCTELRYSSSSDAKTWCQQFCMPNFGVYQWELLRHAYGDDSLALRKMLMFVLNQITQKRLQVDKRVHEWYKVNKEVESSAKPFNLLRDALAEENHLFDKHSNGIVNRSNMMQGIPHETSSSLHASYLLVVCSQMRTFLDRVQKQNKFPHLRIGVPMITSMVSSDDSGILFGLPVMMLKSRRTTKIHGESIRQLETLRKLLTAFGWAIDECKPLFGARVSYEKSTIFAETPVFEFNSKFYVGTSVSTAEVKFLTSQLSLGFHPHIQSRIEESISSLSVALKEGINQNLLYTLQLCLNRMNLRFLYGGGVDQALRDRLGKLSLPVLGWLPLVRKGLVGFFNNELMGDYLCTIQSPLAARYLHYAGRLGWGAPKEFSLHLKIASRYNEVCERYGVNRDSILHMINELDDGPMRFFNQELTEDINIRLKLSKPGVRQTMSFVDLCKIFMAGCYAATTECITVVGDGSLEKKSLLDCIAAVESLPILLKRDTIKNPQIEKMVEMLDNGSPEEFYGSRQRVEGSIQLTPIGLQLGGHARTEIIESWRHGFTGYSLEVLRWAQAYDNRLQDSLEETLRNFGGDVLEIDSVLHKLDEKSKTIHCLFSKAGSHTLTDFYSAYLRTNWSEHLSFCVDYEYLDPRAETWDIRQDISDHVSTVSHYASCAAWGPSCFRKIFLKEMNEAKNEWNSIEKLPRVLDFNNLACLCSRGMEESVFDIRFVQMDKKRVIDKSPNEFFVQRTGFWYRVVRETHSNSWEVRRERGAIMQPELGNRQSEAEDSEFMIATSEIVLVANLVHKRLEVRFKSAALKKGKEFSGYISTQALGPFNPEVYTSTLNLDSAELGRVRAMLRLMVLGGSQLERWDFWENVYKTYVHEKTPDKVRQLYGCLLKVAQTQIPGAAVKSVEGPAISRDDAQTLIEHVEQAGQLALEEPGALDSDEDTDKLMDDMLAGLLNYSDDDSGSEEVEISAPLALAIKMFDEGSAKVNEDDEGLGGVAQMLFTKPEEPEWRRRPDSTITSGTNFWNSLKRVYARAYVDHCKSRETFFSELETSPPLPTITEMADVAPVVAGMLNPWAREYVPWNHSSLWQLAMVGYDSEYQDEDGLIPIDYLRCPCLYSVSNPHMPGTVEFWDYEACLRESHGINWDEETVLPEVLWNYNPYTDTGTDVTFWLQH